MQRFKTLPYYFTAMLLLVSSSVAYAVGISASLDRSEATVGEGVGASRHPGERGSAERRAERGSAERRAERGSAERRAERRA